jgi:hypothetical protein
MEVAPQPQPAARGMWAHTAAGGLARRVARHVSRAVVASPGAAALPLRCLPARWCAAAGAAPCADAPLAPLRALRAGSGWTGAAAAAGASAAQRSRRCLATRARGAAAAPPAPAPTPPDDRTTDVELAAEASSSYLAYAMSVIIGRALPDVRDGLKPVHRCARVRVALRAGPARLRDWTRAPRTLPSVRCARGCHLAHAPAGHAAARNAPTPKPCVFAATAR